MKNIATGFVTLYYKELSYFTAATPEVFIENIVQDELTNLSPQIYTSQGYGVEISTKELIALSLAIEAKQKIKKILFWKNKKLREDYVSENLEQCLQEKIKEWTVAKNKFIEIETASKIVKDKEYYNEYLFQKQNLKNILQGSVNYVNEKIEAILSDIILPVEFSVSYEYHLDYKQLKIDLDLPEIENMPQAKANILSSGKITIKQKTQKELKHEYAQCVSGMAFYLSAAFFNVSTNI